MKRFLVALFLILAACLSARGDVVDNVLLWFLDDPVIEGGRYKSITEMVDAGQKIDTVRVKAVDSNGAIVYLGLGDSDSLADGVPFIDGWEIPDVEQSWRAGPAFADISGLDLSDSSIVFMMEIGAYADDNNWIVSAYAAEVMDALKKDGHIIAHELSYQGSTPWGGAWVVPEPDTGLLVLVGCGLLMLRRRRS